MNGQRRMYPQQQSRGFYNPMMKGPDFAGGIQAFMQQLAGMKQMQSQREQQTWKKGISEREIALKEEQAQTKAQQQPTQTRWDFQKQYAQYMVGTKQWDDDQGSAYLATNKIPQVPVQVSPETKSEIEQFSGVKDFDALPPTKQHDYIRTYALQRNRREPGAPIERETLKLKQQRDDLVSPLVERYQKIASGMSDAIQALNDESDPKHQQYQRKLHNAKKVLDIAQYAQAVVDGGDELSDGLQRLIQQLAYKTREVQTGAFFKTDKFLESSKFFTPDEFGYVVGEVRRNATGEERIYGGNNKWLTTK